MPLSRMVKQSTAGIHMPSIGAKKVMFFYADGNVVSRQMAPRCAVSHVDQFILLTTECHGYNRIFGNESADAGLAGSADVWSGKPVEAF